MLRKHQTLQKSLKYYRFDFLIFRSQILSFNIIYSLAAGWLVGQLAQKVCLFSFWFSDGFQDPSTGSIKIFPSKIFQNAKIQPRSPLD